MADILKKYYRKDTKMNVIITNGGGRPLATGAPPVNRSYKTIGSDNKRAFETNKLNDLLPINDYVKTSQFAAKSFVMAAFNEILLMACKYYYPCYRNVIRNL